MRNAKAIFIKQAKDVLRNPSVLVQFVIFPAVALIMTVFVDIPPNEYVRENMFVTMMASIFAGMALITTMAGVIAEDAERKSLRLLVMAGVKPHEYLLGTGGFILLAGVVVSVVFGLIGGFSGAEMGMFLAVMVAATAASVLLGAIIGILAKNQQAATSIGVPVSVIIGFTPMIANFNETVGNIASFMYTQQLNVIVNDFSASFPQAMAVIGANMLVLLVLFVFAYRKKGLKGVLNG